MCVCNFVGFAFDWQIWKKNELILIMDFPKMTYVLVEAKKNDEERSFGRKYRWLKY